MDSPFYAFRVIYQARLDEPRFLQALPRQEDEGDNCPRDDDGQGI
jgi:hypothetical protein